jgi:hypothetical protein
MMDPADQGYFTIPMLEYRFVEFLRIDTPEDANLVAASVLGKDYNAKSFEMQFGIKLLEYRGYYIEVSYTSAPRGPITPMMVEPILVLRRSRSGQQFRPNVLKVQGYCDNSRKAAWIDVELWEDNLGDDTARRARGRLQEADERLKAWNNSEEAQAKRREVIEELADLVRDAGLGNEDPDEQK